MSKFIGIFILAITLFASTSNAQVIEKMETIVGIGATLEKLADGIVQIIGLIPNAPAGRSGLAVGDFILQDNVRKRASPQGNIHKWTSS